MMMIVCDPVCRRLADDPCRKGKNCRRCRRFKTDKKHGENDIFEKDSMHEVQQRVADRLN